MLLSMPYARFVQATRVAAAERARADQEAWRLAAFIGWQAAGASGALKSGTSFDKYLRDLGLGQPERLRPKGTAEAAAERVRAAFKRGVTKST